MARLLHISASPREGASESLRIAQVFTGTYQDAHPGDEVEHWDLWDGSLPGFADGAKAKMTVFGGGKPEGAEKAAWDAADRTFRRFDAADRLLFSVPMWNGSVPYVLKQFIDVVSQPGMVFGFDPVTGYSGLVTGRKCAVVYTSAVYGDGRGPAFGSDFQAPYFEDWLRWAGIRDITSIQFRPNLATTDAESGRRTARAQAVQAGKAF